VHLLFLWDEITETVGGNHSGKLEDRAAICIFYLVYDVSCDSHAAQAGGSSCSPVSPSPPHGGRHQFLGRTQDLPCHKFCSASTSTAQYTTVFAQPIDLSQMPFLDLGSA